MKNVVCNLWKTCDHHDCWHINAHYAYNKNECDHSSFTNCFHEKSFCVNAEVFNRKAKLKKIYKL